MLGRLVAVAEVRRLGNTATSHLLRMRPSHQKSVTANAIEATTVVSVVTLECHLPYILPGFAYRRQALLHRFP